jgi:hypothetical protein
MIMRPGQQQLRWHVLGLDWLQEPFLPGMASQGTALALQSSCAAESHTATRHILLHMLRRISHNQSILLQMHTAHHWPTFACMLQCWLQS